MAEYIDREAAKKAFYNGHTVQSLCERWANTLGEAFSIILDEVPAADVRPVPAGGIGEMSDGYHTFNGLYYQRMVLFAALVRQNRGKAWKSWKHEDGELCFGGGWFIVGIDTPQGSYTYHYEAKDFDLFDCEELPKAKHWDGHTEEDVTRLLTLECGLSRKNYKPQTNADRIRSMSDEELAAVIAWPYLVSPPWCANHTTCPYISEDPTPCGKCALDWLKEEAKT